MSERFRLEIAYSHDNVGVRVFAKPSGWQGPSANIQVTGDLSPDDAIAFADKLRAKAEEIKAKIAKKQAAEERRRAWRAKQPLIGFHNVR